MDQKQKVTALKEEVRQKFRKAETNYETYRLEKQLPTFLVDETANVHFTAGYLNGRATVLHEVLDIIDNL